ncbi:MAG: prepilin-type N-terminal cleavage/methylation domain-containing protein [Phycisphaerae bacterium]|nr:prepilin-type N-terminal cleavage/methylation domain-containing protein [Phycisphaerae bacterium]
MSTLKTARGCPHGHGSAPARRQVRGLSLVELILVMVVIGVVLAILCPGLTYARGQVRTSQCQMNLAGFGVTMGYYVNDSGGWLPGVNTSGVRVRTHLGLLDAFNQSDMPVQSCDWMTPLAQYTHTLPEALPERWHFLWTDSSFRCPQNKTSALIYSGSIVPAEWMAALQAYDDWTGTNYLMPVSFQHWGYAHEDEVLATHETNPNLLIHPRITPATWEARHETYLSRLDEVGPPARKIFVADGTRYLDANGMLDLDVSPDPAYFGSFATAGAWWAGSTAYGVATGSLNWDGVHVCSGSPSDGLNLPLSYRHDDIVVGKLFKPYPPPDGSAQNNAGDINVVWYDGHVEMLNDRHSRRPTWWYPSGAVVNPITPTCAMMDVVPPGSVIP